MASVLIQISTGAVVYSNSGVAASAVTPQAAQAGIKNGTLVWFDAPALPMGAVAIYDPVSKTYGEGTASKASRLALLSTIQAAPTSATPAAAGAAVSALAIYLGVT